MVTAIRPGVINGLKSGTLELACHPSALCGAFYLNGIFLIWTPWRTQVTSAHGQLRHATISIYKVFYWEIFRF